jgi:hypothetical protein
MNIVVFLFRQSIWHLGLYPYRLGAPDGVPAHLLTSKRPGWIE